MSRRSPQHPEARKNALPMLERIRVAGMLEWDNIMNRCQSGFVLQLQASWIMRNLSLASLLGQEAAQDAGCQDASYKSKIIGLGPILILDFPSPTQFLRTYLILHVSLEDVDANLSRENCFESAQVWRSKCWYSIPSKEQTTHERKEKKRMKNYWCWWGYDVSVVLSWQTRFKRKPGNNFCMYLWSIM